jgi:hypothetical protein
LLVGESSATGGGVMAIDPPTGSTRDYLSAFGVACVYVAALAGHRPVVVGAARDLSRALLSLQTRSPLRLEAAFWVKDKRVAVDLVRQVRDHFAAVATPAGYLDVTTVAVIGELEQVARAGNVALTSHASAMTRVAAAVARVEHEVRAAQSEGRLKFFNRAFHAYRTSGGTLPYRQAYARLRRALFARIAAGRQVRVDVTLLGEIFGGDSSSGTSVRARPRKLYRAGTHPLQQMAPKTTACG